jgi:KDO2-lipid IV(A) lauroyltransferase
MLNRLRESKGVKVIYKRNASREVLTALRQNRFVTMLADQDAGPEGQMVNFLGRPASVTKGPAVFAIKTGAPIITGVIVRQEDGLHRGYIDPPLFPELSNRVEAEVSRLTETFTRRLEEYVIAHPSHWYWVHRRWKTRPEGEPR